MDQAERVAQIAIIADLMSRLAQAADFGTLEEYVDLMTDDVVWEYPGSKVIDLAPQARRGRQDVLDGARERRESGLQGPGTGTVHVVTNISVTPGDIEAHSMGYFHFYVGIDVGTPTLQAIGVYNDRYRKHEGRWKLAHRRLSFG
ncbi:nuclear transport factor 2 family protein [Gordonia sp. NPDC127522]|uniref:nuclear transport factor 2 family protein n=1 Tax=Gordonia sp. NPDC127522 TaxID=3345390 RepID=UPI00363AFED4